MKIIMLKMKYLHTTMKIIIFKKKYTLQWKLLCSRWSTHYKEIYNIQDEVLT